MLPRFYYPEILKGNNQISNKTHVHHICKVLRLKKNDYIQLFDGAGNHAKAKIIEAKKQIIELNVESVNKPLLIQNSKITPVMPILKKNAFLLCIEKLTELGIEDIRVYRPDLIDQSIAKKNVNSLLDKAREVSIAACAQSGNNFIPQIQYYENLDVFLSNSKEQVFVFDTKATDPNISDVQVKNPQASIFVLTGCESGFSSKEGKILQKKKKFFFRTNTLRAETAIIVSCIVMKTIIGEL